MTQIDDREPITVTDDDARGGVTGHHVRYVLAYGLAGIVAAFAVIGLYFGYDRLIDSISQSRDPITFVRESAPYGLMIALGAAVAVALLRLLDKGLGHSDNATQSGMRLRVVLQFAVICVIMAMLYLSAATA